MRKILWELTTRCNLRCRHCYLHSELKSPFVEPLDELGTEECLEIVDQFEEANVFLVEVVGGGEPFCRPDIVEILRHLGKKKFWTRVVTNGTLLTEEIAQTLADIDIQRMAVSLESSHPEINDAIRGKGSFKKAVQGIKYLKGYNIPLRIQMTVNNLNYQDLENMVKFCLDLGADEISLNPQVYCPTGNPFSASLSLGREEYFSAARIVAELKRKYSPKYVYSNIDAALGFLSPESKNDQTERRFHRCDCMLSQVTVLYNGNVLPCPLMRDQILGNLMETHLLDLSDVPLSRKFKDLYNITVDEANDECRRCEWRYFCGGGCRGRAYMVTGDYMAPDPHMCLLAKGNLLR